MSTLSLIIVVPYYFCTQAFGIGALEEEEEVDNVYAVESMISYDNTLAGEGDISTERKYGWTGGHESGERLMKWGKINICCSQTVCYLC